MRIRAHAGRLLVMALVAGGLLALIPLFLMTPASADPADLIAPPVVATGTAAPAVAPLGTGTPAPSATKPAPGGVRAKALGWLNPTLGLPAYVSVGEPAPGQVFTLTVHNGDAERGARASGPSPPLCRRICSTTKPSPSSAQAGRSIIRSSPAPMISPGSSPATSIR